MKKTSLFYIVLSFVLFGSCKEQSLDLYSEQESGSSIFFVSPYNTANNSIPNDSLAIKFSFMDVKLTSADASVDVQTTGPLHDTDREFKIQIDPNGTLKENVHYQFLDNKLVIPAGKRSGQIKIRFLKTPDLKQSMLTTNFRLLPNENFNTSIGYRWTTNMQKRIPVLGFRLAVDDIFTEPYVWVTQRSSIEGSLGKFSRAKLDLIIELFNEDMEHFTDPKYTIDKYFSVAKITYWSSYMKYWLGKEASEGRIHLDENGKEITMGPNAN